MKHTKIVILFFLSLFMTFKVCSQSDNLKISIYHDIEENPCFQLTVYYMGTNVHSQTISDETEISICIKTKGRYSVTLTNCGLESDEVVESMTRIVEIKPFQMTRIGFDLTQYVRYNEIDSITSKEIIKSREEAQLALSYFDYRWNPEGNNPKYTLGIGVSGYHWNSFSKHFGFLIGGGMGFMYAPLRADSSAIYQGKEMKSNYYNYFNAQFDIKFRFSTLNQQSLVIKDHAVFIDIGALYNFPLYFKKTTRFGSNNKLVNSFIHQYSDVRVYVNIGFKNVQFFASYRPFDFIRGDFQELPRYNTGIKFNISYD